MKKIKNILYIILFSLTLYIGITLTIKPLLLSYKIEKNVEDSNDYLTVLKEGVNEKEEIREELQVGVTELKEYPNGTIINKTAVNNNEGSVFGKIVIPTVGIELPILEGIGGDNLLKGAATNKRYQTMGQGNYVLASHYMETGQLFSNLESVKLGDKVYITDYENIYVYEITETTVKDPNEVEAKEKLNDTGEQLLTLYTCTEDGKMRTVVTGMLVGYIEFSLAKEDIASYF